MRRFLALLAVAAAIALLVPPATTAEHSGPLAKGLYFHSAAVDLGAGNVRLMNTTQGSPAGESEDVFNDATRELSWFLFPRLPASVRLSGDATARLWILLNNTGGGGTTNVDLTLNVYQIDPAGTRRLPALATSPLTTVQATTHYSEMSVTATLAATRTVPAGDSLEAVITVAAPTSVEKRVSWGSPRYTSRLEVTTEDYLNLDAARAENAVGGTPLFFDPDEDIHVVADVSDALGLYDVRWVNVTVEAPDGALVYDRAAMARVSGADDAAAGSWELVYSGMAKMQGNYNVTVEAVDNTGYYWRYPDRPDDVTFGGHLETLTFSFTVGQVIYANVRVLDDLDAVVAGARVELWLSGTLRAANATGANGLTNVTNVPGPNTYTVRVVWQGTEVHDAAVNVPGNVDATSPILLRVAIYAVSVEAVDVGYAGLGGAAVFVTYPNGAVTLVPFTADATGVADLGRTAGGTHRVRVVWQGVEVANSVLGITDSGTYRVQAAVYYLTLEARDSRDLPVENVQILVEDAGRGLIVDSVATLADGDAVSRLPAGTYDLEAWWSGVPVASRTGVLMAGNRTEPLDLAIYYVTVRVVDSRNASVLGAFAALEAPTYTVSGFTDDAGQAADLRVPGGTYRLTVTWQGVLVHDESVDVGASGTLSRQVRIYYLTVRTTESGGKALPGVFLTVNRSGVPVAAGVSDASGQAVFRLPGANYTVTARLVTTYLLTAVDLTEVRATTLDADRTLVVTFEDFPLAIYGTVLFWVLIALLVLILLMLFLWRRAQQAKWEEGAGAPPPPRPEAPPPPPSEFPRGP